MFFSCLGFVVIVAAAVYFSVTSIRDVVDPAANGHVGTVVVDYCIPLKRSSTCYGDFTSADGQVTLKRADLIGAEHSSVGQTFTAYGEPGRSSVTVDSAFSRWSDWLAPPLSLLFIVGAFFLLVLWPIKAFRAS